MNKKYYAKIIDFVSGEQVAGWNVSCLKELRNDVNRVFYSTVHKRLAFIFINKETKNKEYFMYNHLEEV